MACLMRVQKNGRRDDQLPARFLNETLPNGNSKGAVFEMKPMLDEYYDERGWDKRGIPKQATLEKLGLTDVAEQLSKAQDCPKTRLIPLG